MFYNNSLSDQLARNKRRAPAKRWKEEKIERTIDNQWKDLMTNIYNTLKTQVGNSLSSKWHELIDGEDFIENLDNSVIEIEFD